MNTSENAAKNMKPKTSKEMNDQKNKWMETKTVINN